MRFFGQKLRLVTSACSLSLFAALFVAIAPSTQAQTVKPYILPYTMSTFAGPHAAYTPGAACGAFIALDAAGDGCLATAASIGADPHDIRVDGQGNVYWIDNNASTALIHKISAVTGRMTVYVGSTVNTKLCGTSSSTQGDGCPANDGAANAGTIFTTAKTPKSRGLAIANNGDLFYADYNGNYDHKVSASTGYLSIVTGTGSANAGNPPTGGPVGTAQVNGSRGIGVDPDGNVYVADTGDGNLRAVSSGFGSIPGVAQPVAGTTYNITAYNPATVNTKTVASGIPATSAILNAVEDVQSDPNGNIYIADTGNAVVRAIYMGKGSLPGIVAPVTGFMYVVAGYNVATSLAQNSYPKDGTTPTFPATSISLSDRKIALDARSNLYIADSNANVVWFVDNATGNIRLLAGAYGGTAGAPAPCTVITGNTVGDGCPAPLAALYSASDMGVSADNQGNIYITDAQAGIAANARLRKVLSGLNFPAVARGASVTQTLLIHFGSADSRAAVNGLVLSGTGATVDYTVGTPACTVETDTTSDCLVPVTFTPRQPGYDTATLTITSTLGAVNSYLLTGTGTLAAVAIDPGSVTVLNTTTKSAQGVIVDGAGNVYTADTGNNRVLITSSTTGTTTTFAGTGVAGRTGDGGVATAATLNGPRALTIDTSGAIYIADTGNNVIRRVTRDGLISTFAGGATAVCAQSYNSRGDGCAATQATFNAPAGLAADSFGVIYVADSGNNLIRAISTTGFVSTFAGGASSVCLGNTDVYGDGCPALSSTFSNPSALAFDATGSSIIVADTGDNKVRSISLGTSIVSTGSPIASTVTTNLVTSIAGDGLPGAVLDSNNLATLSEVNAPTGVAVDAARNIYIADTGNSAIRLVTASGTISTIVGVLGAPGTGVVPGTAANVQLTAPSAVATTQNGTLQLIDAGNNRVLTDARSQVAFNFGRTGIGLSSPVQTFIESSIGTASATLPTPLLTPSAAQTQFTLTAPATGGCVSGPLAVGTSCILRGQFTPAATGTFNTTYTEVGSATAAGDPAITLIGTGAVLTKTTSTAAQTSPAGNSQFGGSVTLTATVTAANCDPAAPTCSPTGTVRFIVDGGNPGSPVNLVNGPGTSTSSTAAQNVTGLSVGAHTISCNYSGDNFYAASSCGTTTITVSAAATTSLLSVTNNNQPQFTQVTLTANVVSSAGTPTGSVTFYANGMSLGTASLSSSGTGSITLRRNFCVPTQTNPTCFDPINDQNNGVPYSDTTLPAGNYTLTCTYSGSANYATSNCAPVTFTVAPEVATFSLLARGCGVGLLTINGSTASGRDLSCNGITELFQNGTVLVGTAQGSTSDTTIFITAANTVSGTLKFSCSGLPAASICTFSPTSVALSTVSSTAQPVYTDMTLWTDLQPGVASLRSPSGSISLAVLLGWPLTLLGFAGVIAFRRKSSFKALSALAMTFALIGSAMVFTGCGAGGPGAYKPNLTPAGTYPITVSVTNGTITKTTTVLWKVSAPGIPGQE